MSEINYFTDGSIVIPHNTIKPDKGAFGFVVFSKDYLVLNSFVNFSHPNINYLECVAIGSALVDISYQSIDNRYNIYTDSLTAYSKLKNYLEFGSIVQTNSDILSYEIIRVGNFINYLISLNYDIHIFVIKGHCANVKTQKEYLNKQGINVSREEAKFICRGNHYVDKLVNNTATFFDAYSMIPYIKENSYKFL